MYASLGPNELTLIQIMACCLFAIAWIKADLVNMTQMNKHEGYLYDNTTLFFQEILESSACLLFG